MTKKGIARLTAFIMAAGFVLGEGGQVAMAAGTGTVLVGINTAAKETKALGEAKETEAATEAKETEAATEAAPQTEAVVDTSMVGTTGFAQCDEYLNVRAAGYAESDVVGKVQNNGAVEILGVTADGWYHIKSGNVDGYVAADYVATGDNASQIAANSGYTTAEVGAEVLNVRAEANNDSDIVDVVSENQHLEVVENGGDWVKVVTDNGIYGYVSTDYVYTSTQFATGETLEEEQARLDQQWLDYLAEQEAEAQAAAADAAAAQATAQANAQAAADAQAQADAAAQAAANAQAQADAAAAQVSVQATGDAAADAQAAYQAYLDAQAAADAAVANGEGEAKINETAAAAVAAYQTYLTKQNAADAAAAGVTTDAATTDDAAAQAAADAQAQADAAAQAAADAQAQADAAAQAAAETADTQEYVDESSVEETVVEEAAEAAPASSKGQEVANFATQFVGNPYVWGGSSLTNGADCSGFVMAVYANFGISLPHSAAAQSGCGTAVSLDNLQPGDLLFYSNGGGIGHVTMYIGGGQVVHASSSTTGIIISNVGYRQAVSARRFV